LLHIHQKRLLWLALALCVLAVPSTVNAGMQDPPRIAAHKVPYYVHVVNSASGTSIPGASIWLDGIYVGKADDFGVLGITIAGSPTSHSYVVSAGGYQAAKGTLSVESSSPSQVIVRLNPLPSLH